MDWQNLSYAVIQVAHNFGAASVVGGSLFALWPVRLGPEVQRGLARLVLAGWVVQGASGGAFGGVSYYWYGQFPDIHALAVVALLIKIACAATGFLLMVVYLIRAGKWSENGRRRAWSGEFMLAATALTAAAFLRWFS